MCFFGTLVFYSPGGGVFFGTSDWDALCELQSLIVNKLIPSVKIM